MYSQVKQNSRRVGLFQFCFISDPWHFIKFGFKINFLKYKHLWGNPDQSFNDLKHSKFLLVFYDIEKNSYMPPISRYGGIMVAYSGPSLAMEKKLTTETSL